MSSEFKRWYIGAFMRDALIVLAALMVFSSYAYAQGEENVQAGKGNYTAVKGSKVSMSIHEIDIAEAMSMLSLKSHTNIFVGKGVNGDVSIDIYNMSVDRAIRSIAKSAGYAVEYRGGSYFIVSHDEVGKYSRGGVTQLRTFKVQYSDPKAVEGILKGHLSQYGKITSLPERDLLVVEDSPEFLYRIEHLLSELDKRPRQILIEAKILEVGLNDGEVFGVDWRKLFSADGGSGSYGSRGFTSTDASGFFLDLVTPSAELALNALNSEGRVQTLSTPKLLALENQQASVVIGDRIGYRITTTINQVTTESIEFLESGVILKVTPSIDADNKVMLDIHPEVSTGAIFNGIPSQTTTEVTTQLLAEDGQTIFIGGLIKRNSTSTRDSVPVLGDIPLVGGLFSRDETGSVNTETVVMITPHIVENYDKKWLQQQLTRVSSAEKSLEEQARRIDERISAREGGLVEAAQEKNYLSALELWPNYDQSWNIADEIIW